MIYLDSRIGSADLAPHLSTLNTPHTLTTLQFGDAWFQGNGPSGPSAFGIERKRLSDALTCMHDSRLASKQLPGMLETYEHNYVIMEGLFRCDEETGVMMTWGNRGGWMPIRVRGVPYMYREWDNWTTSLSMIYGVTIKYTSGPKGTARAITNMYHYFQKHWDEHQTGKVIYSAPPPVWVGHDPHVTLRVAKEFNGIGWKLSKEIALKYGTVRGMLNMDEKSLREINGIGKVKAAEIVADLDKRFT